MRLYQSTFVLLFFFTTLTIVSESSYEDADDPLTTPSPAPYSPYSRPTSLVQGPSTFIDPPLPSPTQNSTNSTSSLRVGFYAGKCLNKNIDVEEIIANEVQMRFTRDPSLLPGMLRLQFHDCFVRGCDASVLLDGNSTEKTASPNRSLRGYDFVDGVKLVVENECPGVVSCADIIAIATKVLIKLGGGPDYPVQTGRRDGLVSLAKEPEDLPSPFLAVDGVLKAFVAKNFTAAEMVVLLGCHTVGIAHCGFIRDRLYPGTTQFDPLMDPNLRNKLISTCPQNIIPNTNSSFLDQGAQSSNTIDNSFYTQIINQRGVLKIDQELARDPRTQQFVQQLSQNATLFNILLANAMIKLQALDVLTGDQGEVRKVCTSVN